MYTKQNEKNIHSKFKHFIFKKNKDFITSYPELFFMEDASPTTAILAF